MMQMNGRKMEKKDTQSCCDENIVTIRNNSLIVLDLDGTLYDLEPVMKGIYDLEVDFYSKEMNLNIDMVNAIFVENSIFPYITEDSRSATEFFVRTGIDREKWISYRNKYDYVDSINIETSVSFQDLELLAGSYKILLLSSNTIETIEKILNHLKIDMSIFEDILCFSNYEGVFEKGRCVEYYCRKHDYKVIETVSIGDRLQTDIMPVVEYGAIGVLLSHPRYFRALVEDMICKKLQTENTGYRVIRKMMATGK